MCVCVCVCVCACVCVCVYIYIYIMGRMFVNGLSFDPKPSHTKDSKWYFIPPYLTLGTIRYVSRVKWSNPGKRVAPPSLLRCSSY